MEQLPALIITTMIHIRYLIRHIQLYIGLTILLQLDNCIVQLITINILHIKLSVMRVRCKMLFLLCNLKIILITVIVYSEILV